MTDWAGTKRDLIRVEGWTQWERMRAGLVSQDSLKGDQPMYDQHEDAYEPAELTC